MTAWSIDQARKTYSIPHWSSGYFDVDDAGRVVVQPRRGEGPSIALAAVVDRAREQGAQLPMLVRFPDILGDRLGALQAAFAQAQADWDYSGGYTAVYPIKVNQHRGVAGTLAAHAGEGFGLEAGSKPELMAVLALSRPGGLVICNGYKDREYIRLALIGRKLGMNVFIVVEKPSELRLVMEESRRWASNRFGRAHAACTLGAANGRTRAAPRPSGPQPGRLACGSPRDAGMGAVRCCTSTGLADLERARHSRGMRAATRISSSSRSWALDRPTRCRWRAGHRTSGRARAATTRSHYGMSPYASTSCSAGRRLRRGRPAPAALVTNAAAR